jgi:hypothetical protein
MLTLELPLPPMKPKRGRRTDLPPRLMRTTFPTRATRQSSLAIDASEAAYTKSRQTGTAHMEVCDFWLRLELLETPKAFKTLKLETFSRCEAYCAT